MMRVNIMLPEDLLDQMDQVASEEGMNRSQLIRTAVLAYFAQRANDAEHQRRQADIQRAMELQDRLRHRLPAWDALRVLREQRQEP